MNVVTKGCLLFCLILGTLGKIVNEGVASWIQFDEVNIPGESMSQGFHLVKLPGKQNYTGIIGLVPQTNQSLLWGQIGFTYSFQGYAPDALFNDTNLTIINQNQQLQIPASGGNDTSDWFFLFTSFPFWQLSDQDTMTISFYVIEMQSVNESVASSAVSLIAGQRFLFKIVGSSPFIAGQVVSLQINGGCKLNSSLDVDKIPTETSYALSSYVYLNNSGLAVYVLVSVTDDCNALSVQVSRNQGVAAVMELGALAPLPESGNYNNLFFVSSQPYPTLTLNIVQNQTSACMNFNSLIINVSNSNFQNSNSQTFDQPSASAIYSTPDLSSQYWFISAVMDQVNCSDNLMLTLDQASFLPEGMIFNTSIPLAPTLITPGTQGSGLCIQAGFRWLITDYYPVPPQLSNVNIVFSFPHSSMEYAIECFLAQQPQDPIYVNIQMDPHMVGNDNYSANIMTTGSAYFGENLPITPQTPTGFYWGSQGSNSGGIALLSLLNCDSVQVYLTSDDWTIPYASVDSRTQKVDNKTSIFGSKTINHGWMGAVYQYEFLNQSECQITLETIEAQEFYLPQGTFSVQNTTILTLVNNASNIGLLWIHLDEPVPVLHIQFDTPVLRAVGQPHEIPLVGIYHPGSPNPQSLIPISVTNSSSMILTTISARAGAASTDFYVVVFTEPHVTQIIVTVDLLEVSLQKFEGDHLSFVVEPAPTPQLFKIPYDRSLATIKTSLAFVSRALNTTTQVLFGSGGFQTTMLSPKSKNKEYRPQYITGLSLVNTFYAPNESFDYYLFVFPNSPAFSFSITPLPVHYLCHPVLLCNGNGWCPEDRLGDSCNCIDGFGYGYLGQYCSIKTTQYVWVPTVCVGTVLVAFVIFKIVAFIHGRRRDAKINSSFSYMSLNVDDKDYTGNLEALSALSAHLVPASIELNDISLVVNDKPLLGNVNMKMNSGELTAVFGPSGAGKSTLIKVLTGRSKATSGKILINEQDMTQDISRYCSSLIGYVPQEDVMNPHMTVKENVLHSALMRLPSNLSFNEKEKIVDQVIDILGLQPKQHVIVGDLGGQSSLSGGQRKRVSIAMELVMCPSILFLDEPTSGLDSKSALSLIQVLKNQIAVLGVNIVTVLHQPRNEILLCCDKIAILADGKLKYFGSSQIDEISLYFDRFVPDPKTGEISALRGVNAADLMIDFIHEFKWNPKNVNILIENQQEKSMKISARKTPWFLTQLYLLTKRGLLQTSRDIYTLITLYGLTLMCALLVGFLYKNSEYVGPPSTEAVAQCPHAFQYLCAQNQEDYYMPQGLFFSLAVGLTAGAASLATFGGTEKLVFKRESKTGQSNIAYAIAKMISTVPNQLIAPLLFVSIFQWLTTPAVPFWKLYVVGLGIFDACMNFAHFVSLLMRDNRAFIVTVGGICINNTLSGFNPTLSQLKQSLGSFGKFVADLSYSRWSLEAFYLGVITTYDGIYDLSYGLDLWSYHLSDALLSFVLPFVIGSFWRILTVIVVIINGRFM